MPFLKIWIHMVWSTKHREPVLTKDIRQKVFMHIKENGMKQHIHVDFVNGHNDHVHCLISMNAEQSIAKIAQLLKGESSFWVNKNGLSKQKLIWQTQYFAISVSESAVSRVREYIRNQEAHHAKKGYKEESEYFIKKYGFEREENNEEDNAQ